jgi:phage recombination protein Bet
VQLNFYNFITIKMSQITTTTTNTQELLMQVVNSYLDTVKTSKGTIPDQSTKQNFITTCLSYGLNPIKRQAYLTGYDSNSGAKFTFIVGIDGFTTIASRTGVYAGKDQARFTYIDNKLDSASVTVYRLVQGQKCAFTGQAYFDEYKQPSPLWQKMPKTMLEKCAFAKALRSAFPESLSGLYTDDEISTKPAIDEPITEGTLKFILNKLLPESVKLSGKTADEIQSAIVAQYSVSSLTELTKKQALSVVTAMQNRINDLLEAQEEKADFEAEALLEDQKLATVV